jgi:hypothetical protein
MENIILEKYKNKRILAVYSGKNAWKKIVSIRWQQKARAGVRRRFKDVNMNNSLLIIFVTPKTGSPIKIVVHFYLNVNAKETDNLWITQAPISALETDDAPKLLKILTKNLN